MFSIFSCCFVTVFFLLFSAHVFSDALLAPDIDNDEYYSETFTLFADLENGAYVYGQIGVSNIGPGNKRGICRLLLSVPGEKLKDQSIIVDKDDWSFSDRMGQTLRVKNCELSYFSARKKLEFTGEIDEIQITIHLHAKPEKHKIPFNPIYTKSGYYSSEILVPWAIATATYQMGEKKIKMSGYGYGDHSRSTLLPAQIASQWLRFRGLNGDHSFLFLARQPDENESFEGWVWQQNNKPPRAFHEVELFNHPTNSSRQWQIHIKDEMGSHQIQTEKHLLRYAPLEQKGFLMKMLSYAVGNPVTYTYRATLRQADGRKISGILEIAKIDGD